MSPYLQRAMRSGVAELLGLSALLAAWVGSHAAGLVGPARSGSTIHRLLTNHDVSVCLVATVLVVAVVLMHCKPAHLPIFTLFFAGLLAGLALASALFYDPWLGVVLSTSAVALFRKGSASVLALPVLRS